VAVSFIGGGNWSTWRKATDLLQVTDKFYHIMWGPMSFFFFQDFFYYVSQKSQITSNKYVDISLSYAHIQKIGKLDHF
jgi:hypothetical protein